MSTTRHDAIDPKLGIAAVTDGLSSTYDTIMMTYSSAEYGCRTRYFSFRIDVWMISFCCSRIVDRQYIAEEDMSTDFDIYTPYDIAVPVSIHQLSFSVTCRRRNTYCL
jgi:hypothetical protein